MHSYCILQLAAGEGSLEEQDAERMPERRMAARVALLLFAKHRLLTCKHIGAR